jgi:predicted dehydrogenase
MLDIGGGHFLAGFLYALGSSGFSSISATTKIAFPKATVVDEKGNPTGLEVTVTNPDQVAFTGILKDVDAVASINLRGGLKTLPGRSAFTWIIDGEEGTIRLDSSLIMINVYEPVLTVNGEVVEVDTGGIVPELNGQDAAGNIARAWDAYANGVDGYSTIEDALNIKKIVDAVNRSSKEGRRIDL